jgi:hypothetical protein
MMLRRLLLLTLLLPIISGCGSVNRQCRFDFEAKVIQGPDLGTALIGNLALEINPTGGISGVLVGKDGTQVNVVGQATGRAVNLAFEVGNNLTIFGVGTARREMTGCGGVLGGPFAGPRPGDLGDWIARSQSDAQKST